MHQQIYEQIIKDLRLQDIHPFHLAVLEECCENAVLNSHDVSNVTSVLHEAQVAFISVIPIVQQSMQAAFQNTDMVSFRYRNREFILQKNIILLTQFLLHMVKMALEGCVELEGIEEAPIPSISMGNFTTSQGTFQQINFQ
jgi:hypothetical protein